MKMKRYCEVVLKDFIKRGIVKVYRKGSYTLFDMKMLRPSSSVNFYKEFVKIYVGQRVTMYSLCEDVVTFQKDGNCISFNAKEFTEYLQE